eukprot:Rhum_TRINITY_DN15428_c5_g1::Rhum_TRINITY_DN15428_c5_g1_i1::g.155753::m.155753
MQSLLRGLQGLVPQQGQERRRRRQREQPLTFADRDRIRRTHLLVCAGALSCLYLLTGCAALVWPSGGGDGGNVGRILLDQLALRTTMHGLLVLAASGLYAASRNRVWLLAACTYLPATSAAAMAAAVSAVGGGGGLLVAALLASQAAAGAALLVAWARLATLTSAASFDAFPDAARPATPFGLRLPASWRRRRQAENAGAAAEAASRRRRRSPLLDTVAYAAVALAYLWENAAAVSGGGGAAASLASGVSLVAGAGHTSVKATLGLFFVVKDNPALPEAGATYVLIVAGEVYASLLLASSGGDVVSYLLSRPADLLHAASVVLCTCLLVQRWLQRRQQPLQPAGSLPREEDNVELAEWVAETEEEEEREEEGNDVQPPQAAAPSSPPPLRVCPRLLLLLHVCAAVHALAWFAECVAGVVGAGGGDGDDGGGCGRVYAAAVALGVGGAHGAVLYGVQSHNLAQLASAGAPQSRGHDRLRRRSFHTVTNLFYLATAAAGLLAGVGGVGSGGARRAEGGTTLSWVLLASAAVRVLAAAASLVAMGWVWEQASTEAEGGPSSSGEGGADGEVGGGSAAEGGLDSLSEHERWRLGLARRAGTGGVVGVVVCVAAVAAWGARLGGGAGGGGSGAEEQHHSHHHHSPGQALMFHFSFLYAVHALVSLHHNRAVSQRFLLAGSPFMLCIVAATAASSSAASSATVGQQGGAAGGGCSGVVPLVLLGVLSLLIGFVAGAILYVRWVRGRHPSTLVSGNVRWQDW